MSHVRPLPSPPEGKDTHTSSLNMAPRALQEPKGAFFLQESQAGHEGHAGIPEGDLQLGEGGGIDPALYRLVCASANGSSLGRRNLHPL